MDMTAVTAGLGQREAQRRLAGEKCAAAQAAAIARDPMAAAIMLDIEIVRRRHGSRDKVAHLGHAVVAQRRYIKSAALKIRGGAMGRDIKKE
jgi:hypothetical protein